MKLRTILIILFAILLLWFIKVRFLKNENESPAPSVANAKNQASQVTGYVLHAQPLENKLYSAGTILANEEVQLRPEVAGKLNIINFTEGSHVRKGVMLAKINDIDLQAQLKKLQLQLKLANEKKNRLKGLLNIQGISQQDYDESVGITQTTSADIDFVKAQIAKTEIYAPFDGTIGLKQISQGSFVTNSTVIATLQQTDRLKLDFTIPEKYASLISIGDPVKFSVDNQKTQFNAKVFAIEPKIDQLTRNITVRAFFVNSGANVIPGSFAKVELVAGKEISALMIPTEAVIPELKGKKVFVCKNGKAVPVKIETGLRNDLKVEVTSGLTEGDTVITTGMMSLKPETPVKFISITH